MNIELLTNNEFNSDVKKLIENLDTLKSQVDIYSIFVEEQILHETV